MGSHRLKGKVAIVTGGGQGIGAGIARIFPDEGAKVMRATRTETDRRGERAPQRREPGVASSIASSTALGQ